MVRCVLPEVGGTVRRQIARERAIDFLKAQDLASRRTADNVPVGIQAAIATAGGAVAELDLYSVLDAMIARQGTDRNKAVSDDPSRAQWLEIINIVEKKLGFPLEPELFSNMLFAAYLGADPHPDLREISRLCLSTFRELHADGLYHFFVSLRFACDIDCTAMAARARLVTGDLDLATRQGAAELRRINDAIFRSAAVCDVPSWNNLTHGKENGPLRQNVFKVYLDDHRVQAAESDRGLKNNPVVVSNALFPVLAELKHGLRDSSEIISLKEYVQGVVAPRTGQASVVDIVAANICYATGYLLSGEWRNGCRYYPSPDAFLCFYTENIRAYPELFGAFRAAAATRTAIEERRKAARNDAARDPSTSLNTALRAIAATNVGLDPAEELDALLKQQDDSGAWTDRDCLYCFGSSTTMPLHFRSDLLTTGFAIRALTAEGPDGRAFPNVESRWQNAIIDQVSGSIA